MITPLRWGFAPVRETRIVAQTLLAISDFRHAFSRTAGAWLQSPSRNLRFLHLPHRFAKIKIGRLLPPPSPREVSPQRRKELHRRVRHPHGAFQSVLHPIFDHIRRTQKRVELRFAVFLGLIMAEHPVGQFPAFRFFAHADAQTRKILSCLLYTSPSPRDS